MRYTHDEIQKMLEPIFEYMKAEHPNNCKLVIEPYTAQLVYEHQEQMWMSNEFHNKFGILSKDIQEMAKSPEVQKLKEKLFPDSEITEEDIDNCRRVPDWAKDCCCDIQAAEQQLKDLKELSYDDYMKKWDANRLTEINKFCSVTCDDNKDTITVFNGRKE